MILTILRRSHSSTWIYETGGVQSTQHALSIKGADPSGKTFLKTPLPAGKGSKGMGKQILLAVEANLFSLYEISGISECPSLFGHLGEDPARGGRASVHPLK